MRLLPILICLTATAGSFGSVWAQNTSKDAIVNDPGVRQSLEPGVTPLGRNPANPLPGSSSPDLQHQIDQSHHGTTGSTQPAGGTRGTGQDNRPEELRDGHAPRSQEPAPR
jgi:hypothetical protein